jgi:hypothetical protein
MSGTRAQAVTLIGLMVGVSLAAGMALAQDPPDNPFLGECNRTATEDDIEAAKAAHQAGDKFYNRGDYVRAIQYWRDVLNLDCNAVGELQNIASAYERLGDRQNAIFALEAYLARNPTGPQTGTLKKRIENLRSLLVPTASATASASASAAPVPSLTASAAPSIAPKVKPPVPVKPYGAAPWVAVGLGGVSLVAGGPGCGVGCQRDRQVFSVSGRPQ